MATLGRLIRNRSFIRRMLWPVLTAFLACALSGESAASSDSKRETALGRAKVIIENFGQVNDRIYRGGQPAGDDFQALAMLGVKTILDLRADAVPTSKAEAEQANLRYINLPLRPREYPQAEAAERFLEIVNDQNNWPVYVHCAGGRHRTGVMIAVYRMTVDGWTVRQAYDEMKRFKFYTNWGHGCYKDYVYDYYRISHAGLHYRKGEPLPSAATGYLRAPQSTSPTRAELLSLLGMALQA